MSRNARMLLALVGILLLGLSLAALIYGLAPAGVLHDSTPIVPTLLTLPLGGMP